MPQDLQYREFNPLKIWHHADRLKALAAGLDVAPVTVEIDPVAFCNHSCYWCVDPIHYPVAAELRFLQELLGELAALDVNGFRVEGIVFKGGGEPTLHPAFPELIEAAQRLGFEVGVVTNGSRLLRPNLADALAEWSNYVRVSIDGPTPDTHRRIHGSQDFLEIIAGVERLISLRRGRHPIVGLSFALDYALLPVIPDAIALGDRLGVDYVLLRPPFFEEVGREATMTANQMVELRQALSEAGNKYRGGMHVQIGNWVGDAERASGGTVYLTRAGRRDLQFQTDLPIEHRLGACWSSPLLAVITAGGEVYGCCNLRYLDAWSFGRLDYQHGVNFASLWKGERRQQLLGQMKATKCIAHCTHPMSRYNEIIEVLNDSEKPHGGFV